MNIQEKFLALNRDQKRIVHLALCRHALGAWSTYCLQHPGLAYVETVCGTHQTIDTSLPQRAFAAVESNVPDPSILTDYQEPMAALQDIDWEPPEHIEYAYYSIYNLYHRYHGDNDIDDWLIVNQSLSSIKNIPRALETLELVLAQANEQ